VKILNHIFKSQTSEEGVFFNRLKKITSLRPVNLKIYQKAFTHRSMHVKDVHGNYVNYERLEFLGDSILSVVVSKFLFDKFPSAKEGGLTKYRAKIVSRESLNQIGLKFNLIDLLALEQKINFGENIHGNLLEALIGAVFIDRGYLKCQNFILDKIIADHVDVEQLEHSVLSYKGLLIEWGQKRKKKVKFTTTSDGGLDPEINYTTSVFINEVTVVKARGISKKKAEEKAAKRAYYALNLKH